MTVVLNKYRISCTTDNIYEFTWAETTPTVCPVNTVHTIDASQTTIVETVTSTDVTLTSPKTADKRPIVLSSSVRGDHHPYYTGASDDIASAQRGTGPQFHIMQQSKGYLKVLGTNANGDVVTLSTADGDTTTRYAQVDPALANQALSVSVVGSDITVNLATDAGAVITSTASDVATAVNADPQTLLTISAQGTGASIVGTQALTNLGKGPDTRTYDYQFIDNLYINSGFLHTYNADMLDWATFELVFPATPFPVVNGTNTGNCTITDDGGKYPAAILIEARAGNGSHDVDITTALNANLAAKAKGEPSLVTAAVPVPAIKPKVDPDNTDEADAPDGFWDLDQKTGIITAKPNRDGFWNLFAVEIVKPRWINRIGIWGPSGILRHFPFRLPIKAKKMLPHWCLRVTVRTNDPAKLAHLDWVIDFGRKWTT